jgi:hypothetical protein
MLSTHPHPSKEVVLLYFKASNTRAIAENELALKMGAIIDQ